MSKQVNFSNNNIVRTDSGNYPREDRQANTWSTRDEKYARKHSEYEQRFGLGPGGLKTGPQLSQSLKTLEKQGRWGGKSRKHSKKSRKTNQRKTKSKK
jgi:hypothetical protein